MQFTANQKFGTCLVLSILYWYAHCPVVKNHRQWFICDLFGSSILWYVSIWFDRMPPLEQILSDDDIDQMPRLVQRCVRNNLPSTVFRMSFWLSSYYHTIVNSFSYWLITVQYLTKLSLMVDVRSRLRGDRLTYFVGRTEFFFCVPLSSVTIYLCL